MQKKRIFGLMGFGLMGFGLMGFGLMTPTRALVLTAKDSFKATVCIALSLPKLVVI